MPVQMTRAEYEAKYGKSPSTSSAPVQMTRAQYEEQYGALDGFKQAAPPSRVPFPASPNDTGVQAGLKAAGNLVPSAVNLGKDLVGLVRDPKAALDGFGAILGGGIAAGARKLGAQGAALSPQDEARNAEAFSQFTTFLKERYGSLDALQKTATEDPFGFGSDVVGMFTGGATLAGKTAQAGRIGSAVASPVTKPVAAVTGGIGNTIKSTAKFATAQATGLNPETIAQVIKNPDAFGRAAENTTRTQLAEAVAKSLDSRLEDLSDIGSAYDEIRKAGGQVKIPNNLIPGVLDKYGIKLKDGKIQTSPESTPLEPGDRAALENFIANYGQATTLSNNGFLNVRKALSNLSKYDSTKSDISTTLARDLRASYDAVGKNQIEGLETLDALYAPERQLLSQLKKDIFDAKGDLKDGAMSKIANLTGKGKERVLERMKEIVPDIEQRVQVLKAVEDIEAASGIKVGTYTRAAAGVTGIATGNIPVLIGAILAQPEVAVPLLRAYGYTGAKAAEVLRPLRAILTDVNNFRIPAPLINSLKEAQPGLSTKAVLPKGVPTPMNLAKQLSARDIAVIEAKLNFKDAKLSDNYFEVEGEYFDLVQRLKLQNKFASDEALERYFAEVAIEANDGAGPALIEGTADGWNGTVSSKRSKAANTSTSNAPSEKGGGSAPRIDTLDPFVGKLYHGTSKEIQGELRFPLYLSDNKAYAQKYTDPSFSSMPKNSDFYQLPNKPQVLEYEINPNAKIFDTRKPEHLKLLQEFQSNYGTNGKPLISDKGLPEGIEGTDIQEFLEARGYKFDAMWLDEKADRGLSFVAFNKNAIKGTTK